MINITLLTVGKIKEKYLSDAIDEYLKRLSRFAKVNIIEVKDEKAKENVSLSEIEILKDKEFLSIEKHINKDDYLIVFDLKGQEYDSVGYAKFLNDIFLTNSKITFLIGGSYGISKNIDKYKNKKVKLSSLTFPHQLCRLIVLESLFRSFKILNNETYHK